MNTESLYHSERILNSTYFSQEKWHSPTPLQFFRAGLLTVQYRRTHKNAVLNIIHDTQPTKYILITFEIQGSKFVDKEIQRREC